jgi:hypothetical protein
MIDTLPAEGSSVVVIRGYRGGTYPDLVESFHRDAQLMLIQGYEPVGQHYVEGQWSYAMALAATVLLVFIVGVFLWAYLLVKRPTGVLTVTYVRRAASGS